MNRPMLHATTSGRQNKRVQTIQSPPMHTKTSATSLHRETGNPWVYVKRDLYSDVAHIIGFEGAARACALLSDRRAITAWPSHPALVNFLLEETERLTPCGEQARAYAEGRKGQTTPEEQIETALTLSAPVFLHLDRERTDTRHPALTVFRRFAGQTMLNFRQQRSEDTYHRVVEHLPEKIR